MQRRHGDRAERDVTRFDNLRELLAYIGLVPSEHSSGRTRRQGGITKAGNTTARRMLQLRNAAATTQKKKRPLEGGLVLRSRIGDSNQPACTCVSGVMP